MSDVPTVYERPTDELRQIRDTVTGAPIHRGGCFYPNTVTVVVSVQRKWLVGNGESYRAPDKHEATDICVSGWHPLQPNFGYLWQPVQEQWRDLPIHEQST